MKANPNLYLLQDGTYADPKECSKGKDGLLRHKNGVGVALHESGEPFTLGDTTALNTEAANAGKETAPVEVQDPAVKAEEPKAASILKTTDMAGAVKATDTKAD